FLRSYEADKAPRTDKLIHLLTELNEKHTYADASTFLKSYKLQVYSWNIETMRPQIQTIIRQQKSDYNAFLYYKIANAYTGANNPKEALKYIDTALSDYPHSPWINEGKNLSNTIRKAETVLDNPRFAPASLYTPVKIQTKNTDSLYIRVYHTPRNLKDYSHSDVIYDSSTFHIRMHAELVYEEQLSLKSFDDCKAHRTIYKLNPLPYGSYTLLVANNKNFQDDGLYKTVTESKVTITDLFVSATMNKDTKAQKQYTALLINRKTGAPFAGKKVRLYEADTTAAPRFVEAFTTNQNGEFTYLTDAKKDRYALSSYSLFVPDE